MASSEAKIDIVKSWNCTRNHVQHLEDRKSTIFKVRKVGKHWKSKARKSKVEQKNFDFFVVKFPQVLSMSIFKFLMVPKILHYTPCWRKRRKRGGAAGRDGFADEKIAKNRKGAKMTRTPVRTYVHTYIHVYCQANFTRRKRRRRWRRRKWKRSTRKKRKSLKFSPPFSAVAVKKGKIMKK